MLVDLNRSFDKEVDEIQNDFLLNKGFEYIDHGPIIGIKTPFQVTDGVNELVYYVTILPGIRVLHYYDESRNEVLIPWLCFEFGIRDSLGEKERIEILQWLRDKLRNTDGYRPFKDEDANQGIFTKGYHKSNFEEYRYKFFMNPDYPNGYWDNHVIDSIDL